MGRGGNCQNRGCIFDAEWEVETIEGVKKRICSKCFQTEEWDCRPEAPNTTPLSEIDMPELIRQGENWHHTREAVEELNRLYSKHGKWKPVSDLLGVSPANLGVFIACLRKKGFEVNTGRKIRAKDESREREPIGRRAFVPLECRCPDCGSEFTQQIGVSALGASKTRDRR